MPGALPGALRLQLCAPRAPRIAMARMAAEPGQTCDLDHGRGAPGKACYILQTSASFIVSRELRSDLGLLPPFSACRSKSRVIHDALFGTRHPSEMAEAPSSILETLERVQKHKVSRRLRVALR
jgi:hypothetical protein